MSYSNAPDTREEGQVLCRSFTVRNKLGIHVRPATQLVTTANKFHANICIKKDELEVNGKSIMGILMLAASQGSEIIIKTEGSDAKEALEELGRLVEEKFGEE